MLSLISVVQNLIQQIARVTVNNHLLLCDAPTHFKPEGHGFDSQ
jgi:hypothetical protein